MKQRNDLLNEVKTKLQNTYRLDQEQQELINDCVDELLKAINYTHCCTQLPTIIEIDFDGHLKCQIETTDKAPTILKAVNGYGQPVDCNKDKIRITEI